MAQPRGRQTKEKETKVGFIRELRDSGRETELLQGLAIYSKHNPIKEVNFIFDFFTGTEADMIVRAFDGKKTAPPLKKSRETLFVEMLDSLPVDESWEFSDDSLKKV